MSELYTHRIEIYTASLLIAGAYDLTIYRRVSDAINGEQRSYLPLRDATIAPLERPQQVQRVPSLLVDRGEALLVATLAEAALGDRRAYPGGPARRAGHATRACGGTSPHRGANAYRGSYIRANRIH